MTDAASGIGIFVHEPATLYRPRLLPDTWRFVGIAERDGLVISEEGDYATGAGDGMFGTLDIWDDRLDVIIADRWIPTEAAFQALNSELALVAAEPDRSSA